MLFFNPKGILTFGSNRCQKKSNMAYKYPKAYFERKLPPVWSIFTLRREFLLKSR